jgi:potassium-transporting ATPase KdpC subunit
MDLKTNLKIAIRFTLITTVLLGVIYPMVITVLAHLTMRNKADGQLIMSDGTVIGSTIIGQSFTGDIYFHGRPSQAAYDAANSGGSTLAQSNKKLV